MTTTLTDFRKEMKYYLDRITDEMETIITNRGKDKGVVLLSSDDYNEYLRLKEESTKLSAAELASINRGLADVEAGRTVPHDEVMKIFDKYVRT
ncbi:type II toxin-antitoxin system Phd/YefM family antitoxin [Bacteroidia bacterium]|nr:type II toxin-antitoxin system Phd/YefM family antitoxin [Bacteroidia bacterium]